MRLLGYSQLNPTLCLGCKSGILSVETSHNRYLGSGNDELEGTARARAVVRMLSQVPQSEPTTPLYRALMRFS